MTSEATVDEMGVAMTDQSELVNWVTTYQTRLLSIAFGILNDPHLAEDCVQETFIKAGLKTNQLKDRNKVFPWLCRILINQCRSQLRSNWIKRIVSKDEPIVIRHEDQYPSLNENTVYTYVMRLPYKWKVTVLLFYFKDLPLSEVAVILRTNESTCRVWLHRARLRLKDLIGGDNGGEYNG